MKCPNCGHKVTKIRGAKGNVGSCAANGGCGMAVVMDEKPDAPPESKES
jgi:hypothetical protein